MFYGFLYCSVGRERKSKSLLSFQACFCVCVCPCFSFFDLFLFLIVFLFFFFSCYSGYYLNSFIYFVLSFSFFFLCILFFAFWEGCQVFILACWFLSNLFFHVSKSQCFFFLFSILFQSTPLRLPSPLIHPWLKSPSPTSW